MEYEKLSERPTGYGWKISLILSIISIFTCGGLIYKIYLLEIQIAHIESKYMDVKEDFHQIVNSDFHWTTGASADYDSYEEPLVWDSEDAYIGDDMFEDDEENSDEVNDFERESKDVTPKLRLKRELIMKTFDGVPVNSESYDDARRKNKTSTSSSTTQGIQTEKSRVMRAEDKSKAFRKIIKRPMLKSADLVEDGQIRRRHRQRRVDSGEIYSKLRPAIHLSGDVYVSNGWSHHEAEHYKNWTRASWVRALGMDQYFLLENGYLRISEPGLYLVYAQVLYFDEHDTNGFYVYKNDDIILQCTTTSHSSHHVRKSNTCYTAGINHLSEGDRLRVHDIESYRYSIFRPGKSFFGAIKLSDARKVY